MNWKRNLKNQNTVILEKIKVSALCPGYLRINIQETTPNVSDFMNSEKNKKMNEDMIFLTPEDCIIQIMRGVRRYGH
jgi:nucleoside 2-deoxyribosyltransferase